MEPNLTELAERHGVCICGCFTAIIPRRAYARPDTGCPRHRTLAERWDAIKSLDDFNAALLVDHKLEWGEFVPATLS